jgi:phage shock protein A
MTKRKKRLKKGINSIENQIELHQEKKELALISGKEELERYYNKEIQKLEERKKDREEKLKRKE